MGSGPRPRLILYLTDILSADPALLTMIIRCLLWGFVAALLFGVLLEGLHRRARGVIDYHYRTGIENLAKTIDHPFEAQEVVEGLYLGAYNASLDFEVRTYLAFLSQLC